VGQADVPFSIDGKTLRRSFDRPSSKAAIHMVSAWVYENHAVFGQLSVDDKSNEIIDSQSLAGGGTVTLVVGCLF
jgi:hypothetical protein